MILIIGVVNKLYRLLDVEHSTTIDVCETDLKSFMQSGKLSVSNAKINKDGKIVGTQGKIIDFKTSTYKPLVIICEFIRNNSIIGYAVTDINGNIREVSKDEMIRVGQKIGIQNARIEFNMKEKCIKPACGEFYKRYC